MKIILILVLSIFYLGANAQSANNIVRKGNRQYADKVYVDAEINYKKALEKEANKKEAIFNLGNAYYMQNRFDESLKQYELSSVMGENNEEKAKAFYNAGNAYLKLFKNEKNPKAKGEHLDKAIHSYKEALKLDPENENARYNLSYAIKYRQQMQKQQQKQQQQKDQDKKQNKDQKKDQKKDQQKDQKKDNKDQKQEKNQQNEKKDEKKGNEKQQPEQAQKISKEESARILKALQNQEKKVQQKLMKKKASSNSKIEKQW